MEIIIIILLLCIIFMLFHINSKIPKRDYVQEAIERDEEMKENE